MSEYRYPKLKLTIKRRPEAQPTLVHSDICGLLERRWTNSDDGLPVCGRCRLRERLSMDELASSTWADGQVLAAGLALSRAIHDTVRLQRSEAKSHG